MNKRVIYITPDCDVPFDELQRMPEDELVHWAKNSNDAIIYDTLEDFQNAFNDELISDLGFIFFV